MRLYNFFKPKDPKGANPFVIREGRIKNSNLEDFSYRLQWTEDSFMAGEGSAETVGKSFDFKRAFWARIILSFFLLVLLSKAAWLQIVRGAYYHSMAEGNRLRIERVEAKRGIIYDRNMKPLVMNTANFMLYFIPADLPADQGEKDRIITEISRILGDMTPDQIKAVLSKVKPRSLEAYQPLFIEDNIAYDKAMLLYLKSADYSGVVLSNKTRRDYGQDGSLSHVLGYTGKISEEEMKKYGDEYQPIDYIGKTGLEYFYEPDLKGVDGQKRIEVDALGKEKKVLNETPGEDGHNLVLSIDLDLQHEVEQAMAAEMAKFKLNKGAAIVMDPNNGEILAMVSLPFYDNNLFAKGVSADEYRQLLNDPDRPLFDRAVSGEYPSGSIVKPVIASGALQEGIIDENTKVLSNGGLRVGQWFFPDWKAGGHGLTDVRKAIAESVNTFFYYIGGGYQDFKGLGVDGIDKYGKLFGLGQQTGIDLPGEATGFLPTKEWKEKVKGEHWYIGDTYHLAIGQGDLTITPLQAAVFTSAVASGDLYRPHLVRAILSGDDQVLKNIDEAPIKKNLINPKYLEIVREGMRQTVTAGSARSLNTLPVEVAGKTGTAQHSSKLPPHAWFTCFAPFDHPQIVMVILVEDGKEGSTVSVPIAKEILGWYFGGRGAATSTPQMATSTPSTAASATSSPD